MSENIEKLSVFESVNWIRNYILKYTGEVLNYKNWGAEFSYEQLMKSVDSFNQKHSKYLNLEICELTYEQLEQLGFGKWSDDTPLRLIPLWLFPFLPETIYTGIGEEQLKKSEMDTDHRCGYLAYGIVSRNEYKSENHKKIITSTIS